MTRMRWLSMGFPLLALLLAGPAARSAPVPGVADLKGLDQVPASAPLVVSVRGFEGTKDRLLALLDNALPDLAPLARGVIERAWKEGIKGRKLRGLAKNGPVLFVFTDMPTPNAEPQMAFVLAVTDAKAFLDNFLKEDERKGLKDEGPGVRKTTIDNEPAFFIERKGYLIIANRPGSAAAFTRKGPGLDTKISKELGSRLLASDVGVYLSMDAFNKQYAEQIKQGRQGIENLLRQATENLGKGQKGQVELARKALAQVFQTVEDSQGLLFSVQFRPTGLALHAETELRAGSTTARELAGAQPAAFEGLGKMPAGQMTYAGMQTGPLLFRMLGGLLVGVSGEEKAIRAALDDLLAARPGTLLDAYRLPPAGLRLWHFADPARAVAAERKLIATLAAGGSFQQGMVKTKPTIRPDARTYGAMKLTHVHLEWDIDKMADASGAGLPEDARKKLAEGLRKLLGSDMNVWFGSNGKEVVQVAAPSWAAAEKLLDRHFKEGKGIGAVPAFRDVRKELPDRASVLMLFDLAEYLAHIAKFVKPMVAGLVPIPPNVPAAGSGKPSFSGLAVTLEPRRARFDFFLSAASVREVYFRFVKPLRGGTE